MRKMNLLLDNKTYGRKPGLDKTKVEYSYMKEGKLVDITEAVAVNIRLVRNPVSIDLETLISKILNGQTWTMANFSTTEGTNKVSRTKTNWISQDIFALDIDNGLTPRETLKRCFTLGLIPTFMYSSFSDTPEKRKFRIVFIAEETVTDYRDAYTTTLALMHLFPECDTACKDPNRLYYGGKELLYENLDVTISPLKIVEKICDYEYYKDSKSCKRVIKKFCETTAINLNNGFPKLVDGLLDYNLSEEEVRTGCQKFVENKSKNAPKNAPKMAITSEKNKIDLIRDFDFSKLEASCPFWNGFVKGEIYPFESEFYGLCSNVLRIKGGEKRIKEAIDKMPEASDEQKAFYKIKLVCFKNRQYPQRCENFCPRYLDKFPDRTDKDTDERCKKCENGGLNMLHAVNNKRGSIRLIEDLEVKTIQEAEIDLNEAIIKAYEAEDDKIYVIKAPTGIGKTTALKSIKDTQGLCIAYPNHRLGKDIVERLMEEKQYKNALHVKGIELEDKTVLKEFRKLQGLGAYKAARDFLSNFGDNLIKETKQGSVERTEASQKVKAITKYFDTIKDSRKTKNPIFCTHKRLMDLNNENINTIIIDEDIMMSSVIQTLSFDETEIERAKGLALVAQATTIAAHLDTLLQAVKKAKLKPLQVVEMPSMTVRDRELNKIINSNVDILKVNIKEMLGIRRLVSNEFKEVLGIKINELPKQKCIILSATANEQVYKEIFNNREVEFIDLGAIETKGELKLHYTSFSRTALKKDFKKAVDRIKEEAPNIKNIITFAKFEKQFKDEGLNPIAHFGACQGLDAYKGQDLIVAGTPHIDERVYLLIATTIKKSITIEESIEYSNVKRNGYEFFFNTYNGNSQTPTAHLLREIQFYLIESELIQATGRARILRTNATVHLFSNLPIQGCVIYK